MSYKTWQQFGLVYQHNIFDAKVLKMWQVKLEQHFSFVETSVGILFYTQEKCDCHSLCTVWYRDTELDWLPWQKHNNVLCIKVADGWHLPHITHTLPLFRREKVQRITGRESENKFFSHDFTNTGRNFPDMVKHIHLVLQAGFKKKKVLWSIFTLDNICHSRFKTIIPAMTPPWQQDHVFKFHTASIWADENQRHLSCLWVVLSLQRTENVSCDIWPHHLEL